VDKLDLLDEAERPDQEFLMIANIRDQFFEILDQQEVEDVIDLNEKFLCMALGGIEVSELALLPKIELRVDTSSHNLQVTGEILASLEYLKLNDSIIRSFRDIGTSFRNVRVLHIARCELREVQGIQAFEQLEELYISFNEIDDLFDISFLEHLRVLDCEGNNVQAPEQLMYLRRCTNLKEVNFKHNPVSSGPNAGDYFEKVLESAPNLEILDDEAVSGDKEAFLEHKKAVCKKAWQ